MAKQKDGVSLDELAEATIVGCQVTDLTVAVEKVIKKFSDKPPGLLKHVKLALLYHIKEFRDEFHDTQMRMLGSGAWEKSRKNGGK